MSNPNVRSRSTFEIGGPAGCGVESGRVRSLNLSDWRLETLPPAIGSLTALTHLDLNGCDALTALPAEIGNLTKLESLH